ncbi:hypothetical protein B0T13DRAFT_526489 [Neurospora crassa]|nr:hypothetical protein B0T13DRAFT_526489 [Neurospora crassa]
MANITGTSLSTGKDRKITEILGQQKKTTGLENQGSLVVAPTTRATSWRGSIICRHPMIRDVEVGTCSVSLNVSQGAVATCFARVQNTPVWATPYPAPKEEIDGGELCESRGTVEVGKCHGTVGSAHLDEDSEAKSSEAKSPEETGLGFGRDRGVLQCLAENGRPECIRRWDRDVRGLKSKFWRIMEDEQWFQPFPPKTSWAANEQPMN